MNYLGRVGSDTGSRGSSPWDFTGKTGFFLTFLHVELTNMQRSQNFDALFFAHLKGEFNLHFRLFFGTNWDKSARDYGPTDFERNPILCVRTRKHSLAHEKGSETGRSCLPVW